MSSTRERRPPGQGKDAATTTQKHGSTPRARKPRGAVVLRPPYVSDETILPTFGVPVRKFRERIVPLCSPDQVTRLGHTVAVATDEVERVMRRLAVVDAEVSEQPAEADDDAQPQTAAAVLAKLGLEASQ
jgi:hypothetical protein